MSEPIVLVDTSRIRAGQRAALETAMKDLVAFVEANEPRPLAYNMYVSEDGTRMTVVQLHPDSESVEEHMRLAGPIFARFADLLDMTSMDVYGAASAALLERLRTKARMLGLTGGLGVHRLHAGFVRPGAR